MSRGMRSVILLLRDVEKSSKVLSGALGLSIVSQGEKEAVLAAGSATGGDAPVLVLQQETENEARLAVGNSPVLCFDVPNMETSIATLMEHGGHMDGAIRYRTYGKLASVRTHDGHMLGLFEPAIPSSGAEEEPGAADKAS